ncbi:LOW QUALITY PROTEIN: laminin subunit gamma-1-like [Haliotis rubra]|uniref:LOW QUALITY PROTEIN: laminin subunit gamma-1-like n=1 Tax=Haliotis rubra TaxID=36100 RepID=UPI001EE5DADE|nr:LOW QUALITY PROTEIN: laminin subunit gamma-1-like [Haliotis rubra]
MAAYSAAGLRQTTLKSCSNGNTRGKMVSFVLAICLGLLMRTCDAQEDPPRGRSSCYDHQNRAQRCMPEFVNAAFGLPVDATNTCGVSSTNEYCLQTGVTGATKSCYYCDARRPGYNHPPEFMTDFNNNYNWTWWQSETMLEGIQYPNVVNLTLSLKKTYDITYVRIRFHSPRPESFAIYKRKSDNDEWVPFQFYSASCERTYGLPRRAVVRRENEAVALCNDEFSDISPLTGGSVAFSTLEARPSAYQYIDSPVLQDWVTASAIKIVLTRMNTFGDEVFGDPQVLKSYFYAISDLAVGARCKCNGHGSECKQVTSQGLEDELICTCEHNTQGPDCGECLPFYNDIPWARATESDAHECLPCDCNNLSNRCHFDQELYLRTGHGGHCDDCRDNTDGPHCERCLVNHYRRQPENRCIDCQCNPIGSESQQCNKQGQCRCKPGVTGDKCDRCEANYFDFTNYGCRPCSCNPSGSYNNEPRCDTRTGECTCKENVEGRTCDSCKPGFFGLSDSQPFGCVPCFCYGHSSICQSAQGYYARNVSTDFETGKQRWIAVDRRNQEVATKYNAFTQNLGVSAPGTDSMYFSAPAQYLGDQRFSYNRFLTFTLRVGDESGARASIIDVVLEGSGQKVSGPIFAAGNRMPGLVAKTYRFRLHEHPDYQWSPRLKSEDFIAILSNLTAIKIRGTYTTEGVGFIDDIKLETARRGFNAGDEASWVEQCTCPEGYVGQFCESCAPGYKRDPMNGGPFAMCVPCECNGHSTNCDVNSGRCICQHNTEGDYCDRCVTGYYGNAREGTSDDCQPCPCPGGGACVELPSDVVCTECPEGYGGNRCDLCLDGYFGDPSGKYGDRKTCQKCFCNDNIDPNAVGNCNATTGECLKCIHNTAGYYCERCLPTFYGDAIAEPKGQCQPCSCYSNGTNQVGLLTCDDSGQCPCLPNVRGQRCDMCDDGYWNLDSGTGCEACDCDQIGSLNFTCQLKAGQCECKPGVTGRRCDTCQRFFYGFSRAGCQACNCDPVGSLDLQCDEYGNCPCRTNVGGRRCDRCMENKFNISAGCIDCPACYDLVQDQVNIHRAKLRDLTNLINNIGNNPSLFNDTKFISVMGEVNKTVNVLLDEARGASTPDGSVGRQLQELRKSLGEVIYKTGQIGRSISSASQVSMETEHDLRQAEQAIERAEISLKAAEDYIDREGRLALDRALQALARFGRQSEQMTEIANRAKLESERQMAEADRIVAVADDALNTSREALRLAQMALSMPGQTARDIQRLNSEYNNADRLYEQTRQLAEKASELAEKAQDEALGLFTESQQRVPSVDVEKLLTDAANIKIQANLIKEEAERLLEQNADLMAEVTDGKMKAEDKLNMGIHLQQRTDELLAEVDSARAKARDAVEMGEKTLKEANETYQTLAGFEDLVKGNKDKADEALKKVPQIEGTIDQAERTTQEARNALSGASDDANKAFDLAKQAQDTALTANEDASQIRGEASTTKTQASNLRNEADRLAEEVNAAESRFNDYDTQSTSDMALAKTALEKANEAKDTAEKASSKVEDALKTVNDILQILDSFEMVDPNSLDALEADLAEVERQLKEADIDAQYKYISSANDNVKNLVRKYTEDYSQLKEDVDNIEDIKDSLIDGCFKSIEIESPAGGR